MDYSGFAVGELPLGLNTTGHFEMHAGEVPVSEGGSSLFFWDFRKPQGAREAELGADAGDASKSDSGAPSRPLVLWLNGGPGCSSMDGALLEMGPLRVSPKGVNFNRGWLELADLVFVDQPAGTGFSLVGEGENSPHDLGASTDSLMIFLEKYLAMVGAPYKNLIVGGESYAGQYVPHLARAIKDSPMGGMLRGITLGNAWLDPNLQSLSFVPFAMSNGLMDGTDGQREWVLAQHDKCQNVVNGHDQHFADSACDAILPAMLSMFQPGPNQCTNVYDVSKVDSYPACGNNWPEGLTQVTQFLNRDDVQGALHVSKKWDECNGAIFKAFKPPREQLAAGLLKGLLDDGIKVQLFSGTNDLICNYMSTELVLRKYLGDYIEEGDDTFDDASLAPRDTMFLPLSWNHEGEVAGEAQFWGPLSYVKVTGASHMVSYDLSERSMGLLEMMLTEPYTVNSTLFTGRALDTTTTPPPNEDSAPSKFTAGLGPLGGALALLAVIFFLGAAAIFALRPNWRPQWGNFRAVPQAPRRKKVHWRDYAEVEMDTFSIQD